MTNSLPPAYFDDLYAQDPDPWRFATSEYERAKYADTIAALPCPHFGRALEIGCAIGVLTQRLAARCDALLAVDVAAAALSQARARCHGLDHVRFARMRIPQEWPGESFDLILCSEVLYYLSDGDLAETAARTVASLNPGGAAVLVHYTPGTNYPLSGDQAAEDFIAASGLAVSLRLRRDRYRLDVLLR
jgi:predicted TPR repeat methyltransferase